MRRADTGAVLLASFAGISLWLSLGTLAVTSADGTRLGAFFSPWLALGLAVAGAALAWIARLQRHESLPLTLGALFWLPWLPTRVPAAFYAWEGPLGVGVWVVIAAGVVAARLSSRGVAAPAALRDPARAPRAAAALFLVVALATAFSLRDPLPGGDEPHYLVITQSLLYDGDLKIQNNHQRGDFLEYIHQSIPPDYLQRGRDGEIYSVHAPGVSALVLPAFAIAGYPGALVTIAALSALAVGLLWRAAFLLTHSVAAAWIGTLTVSFSVTFLLHGFTIFPDPAGAVVVAVAVSVLVRHEVAPATVNYRALLGVGSALAFLPWLHTRFALVAACVGAIFVIRLWPHAQRWRALAAFFAVPLLSAAFWFLFFLLIYGTPNPAAPYGGSRQNALEWIPAGLAGLALDQQFGLISNAPALAALGFGWVALLRAHPRLTLELTAVAVPYTLVVASFGMWWGGWSAPARFLVVLVPLAVPLMASAWVRGNTALRALLVGLTVIGAANTAVRGFAADGTLVYNVRDGFDLLLDWLSRSVNLPLALPSVHRAGAESSALLGAIWFLAGAVALVVMQFGSRRLTSLGAWWTAAAWTLTLCAMLAMSAGWAAARTTALTPQSSMIQFVQQWRPAQRPLTIEFPRWRRLRSQRALGALRIESSTRFREGLRERPLFGVQWLPAGDYRVIIDGQHELRGTLTVTLGATAQSIETWALDGVRPGTTNLRLTLPVLAHSLVVHADDRARATVSRVALQPLRVDASGEGAKRYALRAARYGAVRAFFLDDGLYMEPGGVWTRGDAQGELVIDSERHLPVDIDLTAGPVEITVSLQSDDRTTALQLTPGERRRVQIMPGVWKISTSGAFRPTDFDPANGDARPGGARLEFPQ